jgi:hypothetical protein
MSALQTFFKMNSGLLATPDQNNILIHHLSSRMIISSEPSLSISYTSDLIILFNHEICLEISNLTKSFLLLFNIKGNHWLLMKNISSYQSQVKSHHLTHSDGHKS